MAGKIGRNSTAVVNDVRPFICEFFGGEDGLKITKADLFADNAAATFPLSNQLVDPAYAKLCQVEAVLATIGDETIDGNATTCQATGTDIETGKTKDLEPGGNYAFEVPLNSEVPDFEICIEPGSVVVICGMFCAAINAKTLGVFSISAVGPPGPPGPPPEVKPDPENPGVVIVGDCRVSSEQTKLLCDDDAPGILNLQTTDLKTGDTQDKRFSAAMRSVYVSGNSIGNSVDVPSDSTLSVTGNETTFELNCAQDVMFDFFYDLITVNTQPGTTPTNQGANLYSYLDINGVSGAAIPDQYFTLSDAPYIQAFGNPDASQFGEQNISGTVCVPMEPGVYTIRGVADVWRPRNTGLIYRFSNMKLVANWVELVCK
jgi:hypothetical protein